jgi:hypothetical protein
MRGVGVGDEQKTNKLLIIVEAPLRRVTCISEMREFKTHSLQQTRHVVMFRVMRPPLPPALQAL